MVLGSYDQVSAMFAYFYSIFQQEFAKVVEIDFVKSDLIPMFNNLANDEQVCKFLRISLPIWIMFTLWQVITRCS